MLCELALLRTQAIDLQEIAMINCSTNGSFLMFEYHL